MKSVDEVAMELDMMISPQDTMSPVVIMIMGNDDIIKIKFLYLIYFFYGI